MLEKACGIADTIAVLEQALVDVSPTVTGPHGQTALHPAIPELRQQRLAMARLLAAIDLGEVDDVTPAKRRARCAAEARWGS